MSNETSLKHKTDREELKKESKVTVNSWGTDRAEEFGKRNVCDKVGLISGILNVCKMEKRFCDLFCMR